MSSEGFYYNGTKLDNTSTNTFTNSLSATIFAIKQANNLIQVLIRNPQMKVYSCKIWQSNTLVNNFIPCYRISDNVIGMYDVVGKQFYTNAGSGSFTKGSNALTPSTPIDIEVVTGTQEVTISNSDNTETQTQQVSLGDIELCKIGTYQDYLYKSNDKWYKKEYIGKHKLSTSDTWALNRSSNNLYQYRTKNDLLEDVITSPDPYSRAVALCNYYTKGDINGMTTQCFNIGVLKYIGITSDISTLANFNTFITNNSIYVYYVCQTPNDIEITDTTLIEQLDNLEKMKSYNGVTNINCSGNLSAILGVSALKGE